MRLPLIVAAVALCSACQPVSTAEYDSNAIARRSAEAHEAIDAINARYQRFVAENMADSVAALFAEDGVMMPPNAPAVTGRAAIRDYLASGPTPAGTTVTFTALEVHAVGPMAVERGSYVFAMPAMGTAPPMAIHGKYLVHWRMVDGTWLQASTSWSDDAPWTPPGGASGTN